MWMENDEIHLAVFAFQSWDEIEINKDEFEFVKKFENEWENLYFLSCNY